MQNARNKPNNTHILLLHLHLHTHTYRKLKGDSDDDDEIIDRAGGQKQVFGFEPLPHERNETKAGGSSPESRLADI